MVVVRSVRDKLLCRDRTIRCDRIVHHNPTCVLSPDRRVVELSGTSVQVRARGLYQCARRLNAKLVRRGDGHEPGRRVDIGRGVCRVMSASECRRGADVCLQRTRRIVEWGVEYHAASKARPAFVQSRDILRGKILPERNRRE